MDGKLLCAKGFEGLVREGCLGGRGCGGRDIVSQIVFFFQFFLFSILPQVLDVVFGVADCLFKDRFDGRCLISPG